MREQYLVRTDDNMSLIFPAGFRRRICVLRRRYSLSRKGRRASYRSGGDRSLRHLFGRQEYLDAGKGVSCTVQIVGAERMTAVYQHKDWWIRPAFPGSFAEIPERTQLLLLKGGET